MKEMVIIIDLPDENILKALKLKPFSGPYDSVKLKAQIKARLSQDFPELKDIKVSVKNGNPFVGIDVMGINIYEVLDMMKKISEAILEILEAEMAGKP